MILGQRISPYCLIACPQCEGARAIEYETILIAISPFLLHISSLKAHYTSHLETCELDKAHPLSCTYTPSLVHRIPLFEASPFLVHWSHVRTWTDTLGCQ